MVVVLPVRMFGGGGGVGSGSDGITWLFDKQVVGGHLHPSRSRPPGKPQPRITRG